MSTPTTRARRGGWAAAARLRRWGGLAGAELMVMGPVPLLVPALVGAGFGLLAGAAAATGATAERVGQLLSALPEAGLSLSAGICAAIVVLADPDPELQLSLPARFPRTVLRRLALVLLGHAFLASLFTALLLVSGWWFPPLGPVEAQLAWLAPTLWLTGAGAAVATRTGSRSAAVGLVGAWWLAQHLFTVLFLADRWAQPLLLFVTTHAPGAGFWLPNRLWLLAQAGVLLGLTYLLASRGEALLARDD